MLGNILHAIVAMSERVGRTERLTWRAVCVPALTHGFRTWDNASEVVRRDFGYGADESRAAMGWRHRVTRNHETNETDRP
jgi:hypothetical protein